MNKYAGKDNYGKPKAEYVARIAAMDDATLQDETKNKIWLAAYAANNPRSDYHWHCDACYDECQKRDDKRIYDRAFKLASA